MAIASISDQNLDVLTDTTFHALADYFGHGRKTRYSDKENLKWLMEWARRDPEVKDDLDLLWKVRTAEKSYPTVGSMSTNRAGALRRLLWIQDQADDLDKEKQLVLEGAPVDQLKEG